MRSRSTVSLRIPLLGYTLLLFALGVSATEVPLALANSGFETGSPPAVGAPGWTITSGGTDWFLTTAGAPNSPIDPLAASEGANWLTGNRLATGAGSSSNPQLIEQLVDLSAHSSFIDSGGVSLVLDWDFQDDDPNDSASLSVSFFSNAGGSAPVGTPLLTGTISPSPVWAPRTLAGTVPPGARSLLIELRNDRSSGSAGNVHFDNFQAILSDEPLPTVDPADHVVGNLLLANENAGQCWYQDERIIYDPLTNSLHMSTTADASGFGGSARNADVDHASMSVWDRQRRIFVVGNEPKAYGADDHNMGALWTRPDGRYLHVWAGHNGDHNSYYRISSDPGDTSAWGPEQSYNWETISGMSSSRLFTYSNLFFLTGEGSGQGRLYNIGRGDQNSPNISYSDDWGDSWSYAGKLTTYNGSSPSSYSNGYFKFNTNGKDRIDFVSTEHHPRNWNNSIYHGYIQGGKSYNSFGVEIDNDVFDETAPDPKDFTPVWMTTTNFNGNAHHAWTTELERAPNGDIVTLFTSRFGTGVAGTGSHSGSDDHRIFYARFDGVVWTSTELAKMGGPLYGSEQDYTGLGAIHPNDPSVIYISTPIDPRDDTVLARHEIFRGNTADNGATWTWTSITSDSSVNNFRPVIAKWDANNTAVFWLRGFYNSSQNYDQTLVGLIESPYETVGQATYHDATPANTTHADDAPLSTTGPDSGDGSADDFWHERTGLGNGGSVLTTNATAIESAPVLKTSVGGLADGTYDVFVYFWSSPSQDWRISAGMDPANLVTFRRYSCQQAAASHFTGPAVTLHAEGALYRACVGRATVTGGQAVDVFVSGVSVSTSAGTGRTVYDGIGIAPVEATLRVEPGASFSMPDSTLVHSDISNEGSIDLTHGSLLVTGDAVNDGTIRMVGDAGFVVGGTLTNNGLLDLINWNGTLPTGFINNGTVLDASSVRINSIEISGNDVNVTISGHAGHSYQLQKANNPQGPWSDHGLAEAGAGTEGVGVALGVEDLGAFEEDGGPTYYRFQVEPVLD